MSLIYYGSHQYFVTKENLEKMINSVDYSKFKALIVKQLKLALNLPSKGSIKPMMDIFYKYDPLHIIT